MRNTTHVRNRTEMLSSALKYVIQTQKGFEPHQSYLSQFASFEGAVQILDLVEA